MDKSLPIASFTPDLAPEKQKKCLEEIESNVKVLKSYPEENIDKKEHLGKIPETGMAVLQQQFILAQAIEAWITSLKESLQSEKRNNN